MLSIPVLALYPGPPCSLPFWEESGYEAIHVHEEEGVVRPGLRQKRVITNFSTHTD